MTVIVYALTLIINSYFLFIKKKSKFTMIFSLIVIIILMTGNGLADNSLRDYSTYQYQYDTVNDFPLITGPHYLSSLLATEIGMDVLMKIGNFLGLTFFNFRFIVITICIITIFRPIINSKFMNGHLNIILYLLHPIMIDSVQFSNFVALTLFLIAINYLAYKTTRGNFLFIFYIFLASLFHAVFIIYLSLLLLNMPNKKILIRIVVAVTIGITILTYSGIPYLNNIVNIVINYVNNPVYLYYLSNNNLFAGFGVMLIHLVNIVATKVSVKLLNKKTEYSNKDELKNYVENNYWIHIVSIMFFVLYIININFYRLPRNYSLINFNSYSITMSGLNNKSLTRLFYFLLIISSSILWFVFEYVSLGVVDGVLVPFFTQNYFLN